MVCIRRIGFFRLSVAIRKVAVKSIQILKKTTPVSLKSNMAQSYNFFYSAFTPPTLPFSAREQHFRT